MTGCGPTAADRSGEALADPVGYCPIPGWQPPMAIRHRLAEAEGRLRQISAASDYASVSVLSSHLCRAGGKRLRSALVLLAADLGKERASAGAVEAAVAVELLHLATLYHDDVIDGASHRRGQPCAHRLWGSRAAVMGGTLLFAKALGVLAYLGPEANARASAAAHDLWLGQTRECESAFNTNVTDAHYFELVDGKTASLFNLACTLGALCGGLDPARVAALGSFGAKLGTAYQLVDDILDLTGDTRELGKPRMVDLVDGVYTLPTIACLRRGDGYATRLQEILEDCTQTPATLREAADLIVTSGAVAEVRSVVRALVDEAIASLAAFTGPAVVSMTDLARWLAARAETEEG